MKLYECIDKYILEFGIKKIFGVPGSLIMPIWQNIKSAELILCSHEQEASYLATGYSKMSREPVMVVTTGGPGVTNCVSGIAAANLDSLPLIYISGRTPVNKKEHGQRQEEGIFDRCYDSNKILNSVTKKSICITNQEQAAQDIYMAFQYAVQGRMGSVHISIPVDIQDLEVCENVEQKVPLRTSVMRYEGNCVQEFKRLLEGEKRRLLIIGWGCWLSDTSDYIYQIAEKIGAPVICTVKAYCCMKENPHLLGKLGYGYNKILSAFIKEYNPQEVLVFGSSLSVSDFSQDFMWDIKEARIHAFSIGDSVTGCGIEKVDWHSIKSLKAFFEDMREIPVTVNDKIKQKIIECRAAQRDYYDSFSEFQNLGTLCKLISDFMDENVTVTADAGNHLLEVATGIWPKDYRSLFLDDGIRAMGSGICETVGMAFANNKRHYIAVTGDGCMLMNGNIMYVAKKYKLPVIFLVINNASLGRVRVGQMNTNKIIQSDLGGIDFTNYANTFGVTAYSTMDVQECRKLIQECLNKQDPVLIEMQISKDEIPIMLKAKGVWN